MANNNSNLLKILREHPIAFNPVLGRISKSAIAGLFMSQLLYWQGKGEDIGWTYKTIIEFEFETCLTRSEQDRAIRIWKSLKVLEVERIGLPARRSFSIDEGKLVDLINAYYGKRVIKKV